MKLTGWPAGVVIVLGLVLSLFSKVAAAHKFAPALLEVEQIEPEEYRLSWRTSVTDRRTSLPQWPDHCVTQKVANSAQQGLESLDYEGSAVIRRWLLRCPGGLEGHTLNWPPGEGGQTATLVRMRASDEDDVHESLVMPGVNHFRVPTSQTYDNVVMQYLYLGGKHILIGLDHLLFVAALLLLAGSWRTLLKTVTAFTVGHSITLVLVSLKVIPQWSALIEFGIAVTILVLALELSRGKGSTAPASLLSRYQWPVAGVFGLVHGLGFAGVLSELGLPKDNLIAALFAFNVGIELGQLVFVAGLAGCLFALRKLSLASYRPVTALIVYAMGSVSVYWCLSRGLVLLG